MSLSIKPKPPKMLIYSDIKMCANAVRRKLEDTIKEDPDGCEYIYKIARDCIKAFAKNLTKSLDCDIRNLSFEL